jgi:hypothetical protein
VVVRRSLNVVIVAPASVVKASLSVLDVGTGTVQVRPSGRMPSAAAAAFRLMQMHLGSINLETLLEYFLATYN